MKERKLTVAYRVVSASLSVTLFGAFQISLAGEAAPSPRARSTGWVLALLILRRGREVDRHWLAETLWPDAEPNAALYNLRRSLSELRKMLGSEAFRLESPTSRTLRFDSADIDCDLIDFETLIARKNAESLREAVSLYRGELLEGCREEWVLPLRIGYEHAYLNALEDLAESELQNGNLQESAQWLRRLTTRDPLREDVERRLMETLGNLADYTGVERQYRELRRRLLDELNHEPAAETTALYQQLRAQNQSSAVLPSRISPPAPSKFNNLPCSLTSLIGRVDEKSQICAQLRTSRVVTLVGAGGVGKTRMALAIAEDEADRYAAGVCFADLSAAKDATDIPRMVAAALEVRSDGGELLEAIIRFLRQRHLLLILDNTEQVSDDCASFTGDLLLACPDLKIFCTSRQPLYAKGEVIIPVSPLNVPDELKSYGDVGAYVDGLAECDSVALLLERILSAVPSFRLTSVNALPIAQICRRLDGLPLALELVAARFRSLSPQEIADRLESKFRLLTGGDPALPRHQTLQTTLDWSYDLLSVSEQRLFRHLSVFRGGWTLEAAEAIQLTAGEKAASLLSSLVDKSLVVAETRLGRSRYRFLEMTRQYAQERLVEAEEEAGVRCRHRDHFLLSQQAHRKDLDWLKPEQDNLQDALAFSLEECDGATAALTIASALYEIWNATGDYVEGHAWLERALKKDGDSGDSRERMVALFCAAFLALKHGDMIRAEQLALESLRLAQQRGEGEWQCAPLIVLGHVVSDLKAAQEFIEQRVTLQRIAGNSAGLADALADLSVCFMKQCDFASARPILEEAEKVAQKGKPSNVAYVRSKRALLARLDQDWATARLLLEEDIALCRERNERPGNAFSLRDLGVVCLFQGDLHSPFAMFTEATQLFQSLEDPSGLVRCLEGFAQLAAAREETDRALRLFSACESLRKKLDLPLAPCDQTDYESVPLLQAKLSPEALAEVIESGGTMTLDQAVEFALDGVLF